MPLEIRELVIKTSVNEEAQGSVTPPGDTGSTQDQSALINACVEQVLSILKEKAER